MVLKSQRRTKKLSFTAEVVNGVHPHVTLQNEMDIPSTSYCDDNLNREYLATL